MSAESNVYQLPERPSADSNTQSAPTRTREEDSHEASRLAVMQKAAGAVFAGDSLLHRQPPSLAQSWERHTASARHFNAWLLRGPRWAWGALTAPLRGAAYVALWVIDSPPLLAITALTLFLIHQFL